MRSAHIRRQREVLLGVERGQARGEIGAHVMVGVAPHREPLRGGRLVARRDDEIHHLRDVTGDRKTSCRHRAVIRDLDLALEELSAFRSRPRGTLRINSSDVPARLLLHSVVPTFLARHPEMSLDLVTDGKLVDIVAEGFDAGIRLGEQVPQDMIGVRFGGDVRFIAVAAPQYLKGRKRPRTPDDLKKHACIRFRLASGKLFRWEFGKKGQELTIDVPGALTLDQMPMMAEAAALGLGIAYVVDTAAQQYLDRGEVVMVLEDWCPKIPGLFLYYPGHRHVPPGLRALIDVLKEVG